MFHYFNYIFKVFLTLSIYFENPFFKTCKIDRSKHGIALFYDDVIIDLSSTLASTTNFLNKINYDFWEVIPQTHMRIITTQTSLNASGCSHEHACMKIITIM